MAKRILVVGCANIEFRVPTPYVPAPEEVLMSDGKYGITPAGDGAIAAVTLAKLSLAEADLCARVGDDYYGDRLIKVYRDLGVNTNQMVVDKTESTALSAVFIEDNGVKRTVMFRGANRNMCENDVDRAFGCYPDAVLLMLSSGESASRAATLHSGKEDVDVFIDCSGISSDFPLEKLGKVVCISPNESEAEMLTGIRPNSIENCLRASIALSNRIETSFVVLKLGSRGCFVYDGKYCDLVSSYDVPCVDKSGAGAAFTAALAGKYLACGDMRAAAKYANAVASLFVSKSGVISSIPDTAAVEKLM